MKQKIILWICMALMVLSNAFAFTVVTDSLLDLGLSSETDPIYGAWDKSTGISITESQVSDLAHTVDTDTNETTRVDALYNNITAFLLDTNETTRVNALYVNASSWNSAFDWGDHALEGYLTSYTETDPDYYSNPLSYYNSSTLPVLTNSTPTFDLIDFNLTPNITHQEGRLHWDEDANTLSLGLTGGEVELQIGQEQLFRAKNTQGSQIDNGQLVYVSGSTGAVIEVKLSNASHPQHSLSTLAFATENVSNNQLGYFTTSGFVRELDTSAFSDGDALFLSPTDGEIVNIPPNKSENNRIVFVGFVTRSHATDGSIYAKILAIPFLEDLSNVIGNCSDGEVLSYENVTQTWVCSAVSGITTGGANVWTGKNTFQEGDGDIITSNNAGAIVIKTSTGGAGAISFGTTADIGISSDGVVDGYDYDGTFVFKQDKSNPDGEVEYLFLEETGDWRFALPSSGVDHATYNPRSMIVAGASVNNASNIHCSYWGFSNLDCDTGGTGADLGVQDDLEVLGKIYSADWTDVSITESQISDLSHTVDTNETTRVDALFSYNYYNASDFVISDYYLNSNPYNFYNASTLTVTESQISDLTHTVDTNETTRVDAIKQVTDHFTPNSSTLVAGANALTADNIAYYSLDDSNISAPTVYDETTNYNLTIYGSATTGATGIIGEAINFDGTNDYLRGSTTGLNDFTISFWINPDDVDGIQYIVSADYNSANSFLMYMDGSASDYFRFVFDGSGFATDDVMDTEWQHLVLTRESSTLKLYSNASLIHTQNSVSTDTLASYVDFGWAPTRALAGSYFDGLMDEIAIFDVALNQTQINTLFNSGDGYNFYTDSGTTYSTIDLNTSLNVDGVVIADDYITKSKVPIIDGHSALSQLSNIAEWSKNGKVQYNKHYAKTKLKEDKKLVPVYTTTCETKFNLTNFSNYEECTNEITSYTEESVITYGLSMETRVAQLEKMVYELWLTKKDN